MINQQDFIKFISASSIQFEDINSAILLYVSTNYPIDVNITIPFFKQNTNLDDLKYDWQGSVLYYTEINVLFCVLSYGDTYITDYVSMLRLLKSYNGNQTVIYGYNRLEVDIYGTCLLKIRGDDTDALAFLLVQQIFQNLKELFHIKKDGVGLFKNVYLENSNDIDMYLIKNYHEIQSIDSYFKLCKHFNNYIIEECGIETVFRYLPYFVSSINPDLDILKEAIPYFTEETFYRYISNSDAGHDLNLIKDIIYRFPWGRKAFNYYILHNQGCLDSQILDFLIKIYETNDKSYFLRFYLEHYSTDMFIDEHIKILTFGFSNTVDAKKVIRDYSIVPDNFPILYKTTYYYLFDN